MDRIGGFRPARVEVVPTTRELTAPPAKTCGGCAKFYALALGGDSKLTAFLISVIAFLADAAYFFGFRCNSFGNRR
jgi:hypothetical protein